MIQLYGNPRSRAMRCMWMLEEIGQPYELVEKHTKELQTPEYLQLNPNARIPTLVDDGAVIWESMAINLYLAQKYEGPFTAPKPKYSVYPLSGVFGPCWKWRGCCWTF